MDTQQTWFTVAYTNAIGFFEALPFSSATWMVLMTLGFFVFLFARANNRDDGLIWWEHLIVDSHNNRASPYKTGYLVGMIVSTWVVMTALDRDRLTLEIFGTYLTYLVGGAGLNSYFKSKEPSLPTDSPAQVTASPEVLQSTGGYATTQVDDTAPTVKN